MKDNLSLHVDMFVINHASLLPTPNRILPRGIVKDLEVSLMSLL